jgi:hypothetical protein
MSSLLSPEFWAYFNNLQSDIFDTFGNEIITYKKELYNMDFFGEDGQPGNKLYSEHNLRCVINYNYYRVWGVNNNKQTGEKEASSFVVIFNRKYLIDNFSTIVDNQGNLLFDSGKDFFIHKGLRYTAQGETFISQNADNPILFMVILQRDKRYNQEAKGQQT